VSEPVPTFVKALALKEGLIRAGTCSSDRADAARLIGLVERISQAQSAGA
jgi:hypothetical protein